MPDGQVEKYSCFLTRVTEDRILFLSRRSNYHKLQDRHRCNIALFALAKVAEIDYPDVSHLKEILVFDFFENDAQRFWLLNLLRKHRTILV